MIHAARKAGTFLGEAFMYRLHPQTLKLVELVKSGAIGEVRHDPLELRLRHAGLHAGAPALRQRPRRRRHPRCRRLSGVDGAADRRRRGGQAVRSIRRRSPAPRISASPASTNGRRRCCAFRAASSPRCPAAISLNQDNVLRILGTKGRIEVPDFWFAGGNATAARAEIDIIRPDGNARRSRQRDRAASIRSRSMPPARRSAPAGRNSPGRAWAGPTASATCACSTNGARRPGSNTASRSRRAARQHDLRPQAAPAAQRIPQARRSRALRRPASVVALGFEDFRTFSSGCDPARRLLRGRRQSVRHRLRLWRRLHRDAVRRMAARAAACASNR